MADQFPSSKRIILMALDDSDASTYALSWALDNLVLSDSHGTPIDSLVLLHVQFHHQLVHGYYMTPELQESIKEHHDEVCKRVFERAKEICRTKNVENETMLVYGDPREAICDTVDTLRPSLLILGSHGYGALRRAFLGSVSDYCAHHADCAVVIVKKV